MWRRNDVRLDGVSLDSLSSAEQLQFAVQIAARATKSGILLVDRLETLDPPTLEAFVSAVARAGLQLVGTRVTSGPLDVRPVAAPEATAEAAS